MSNLAITRALRSRPFALIWGGQTLSRIGDFLYDVALAWWVLQRTGSAATVAAVLIFAFTPMLLFLLIGGVAGDRLPRIAVMLASDLGRGLVVAVVAALALAGRLEVWHVFVASLLFGFVDAFFQPAYAATVPELVPEDDLPSANALSSISVQAGRIVGPAVGAAIVALGGTPLAFAINAGTFFISGLLLLPLLRRPAAAPAVGDGVPPERPAGVIADLRAGLATVAATPWLWITIGTFALSNITLAGPYSVAMPFLISQRFGGQVGVLGLIYALFPTGYLLASLWAGSQSTLRRRGLLIYVGSAVAGLMLGLFGLPLPLAALGAAALINGAALELCTQAWMSALQTEVPREQLGRVSSIDSLGSFALLPIGLGVTGWATDRLGAAPVFLIGGGTTAALTLLALLALPAVRRLD
jgi:DHA3 family tetracycline resistance protein-like MFS transporter